jgi:hypothetical protein
MIGYLDFVVRMPKCFSRGPRQRIGWSVGRTLVSSETRVVPFSSSLVNRQRGIDAIPRAI